MNAVCTCPEVDPVKRATTYVDIVFDGPPDHESGRFVEVEKADRSGVKLGNWVARADGYWALRITREDVERVLCDTDEPTGAEVEVEAAADAINAVDIGQMSHREIRLAFARAALRAAAKARR